MLDELLTENDVAAYLQVSTAAVRKWRREGRIAFIKVGTLVRYKKIDIDQFVQRGFHAPLCAECGREVVAGMAV